MKIPPMDLTKIENAYDPALKTGENRASGGEETGLPKDRVCLSEQSQKRSELQDAAAFAAEEAQRGTSPEKLRELRAAIENGTYRVDGESIAAAILGDR